MHLSSAAQEHIRVQCMAMGINIDTGSLIILQGSEVKQEKLFTKKCFSIARHVAAEQGHGYVEGFLISAGLDGLAIGHAWNFDQEGKWRDYSHVGSDDTYVVVKSLDARAFRKCMEDPSIVREFEKHTELPLTRALGKAGIQNL